MIATAPTAVCGTAECGSQIYWRERGGIDGPARWYHKDTERTFCFRDPKHTETAWPAPGSEANDVIGYVTPCTVCGRRALITSQMDGYVCIQCSDVAPNMVSRTADKPRPTDTPCETVTLDRDDPLAGAIRRATLDNPRAPLDIHASVAGQLFHLEAWEQHAGSSSLHTRWAAPLVVPPAARHRSARHADSTATTEGTHS